MKTWNLTLILSLIASTAIAADAPSEIETPSGVTMILLPGGDFQMGSESGEIDEQPVHQVSVSPFAIDKTEVTQASYSKLMGGAEPSRNKGARNPVERVRWSDAVLYCIERSYLEELEPVYNEETWEADFSANGYRLPTEAEWEFAARAGTEQTYWWGDPAGPLMFHAWFDKNSKGSTHEVASKKANPWNLADMLGNVAEWCHDRYSVDYYKSASGKDPRGPESGDKRVLRGGHWNSPAEQCTVTYRFSDNPGTNDVCFTQDTYGFRCVRALNEEELAMIGMPADIYTTAAE